MSIVEFVKAYRELVKKIGTGDALTLSSVIFRSPNRARVFLDLCDKGTTTAQDIMERLDVTETTTYRILGDLKELEVIEIAEKVRRSEASLGGSPTYIWRLSDVSRIQDLKK